MKYSFYKLVRDWAFWIVIFVSILFVFVYSAIYLSSNDSTEHEWYYKVSSYATKEDIEIQQTDLESEISNIESELSDNYDSDVIEELNYLRSSLNILEYLKKNIDKYSYSSLFDGSYFSLYEKTPFSYFTFCTYYVFIFQFFALIFSIGQIVNKDKQYGEFFIPFLLRGRRKMFERQCFTSFIVFSISYFLQIILIGIVSLMLLDKTNYVVYTGHNKVFVFPFLTDYIFNAISLFIMLIFFWAMIFFCSQLIDNILGFSLTAAAVTIITYLVVYYSEQTSFLSKIFDSYVGVLNGLDTLGEFLLIHVFRIIMIALFLSSSYLLAMRKNYRIKYS